MKKFKLLIIFILILTLAGCSYKEEKYHHISNVNYKEFKEKLDKKEDFILFVTREGCHFCDEMRPHFEKALASTSNKAFELDVAKISEEESDEFLDNYKINGTPHVLYFKKGEEGSILKRITHGGYSEKELTESIKNNGF